MNGPEKNDRGVSMYEAHKKIYARAIAGRFTRARGAVVIALLGLYYLVPWVSIGSHPAVHFDLPARRFHILGMTFIPQDLIYLTFLLLIAAMGLFFFTNLAGRLWCGYACPQTVWTEAFMWMERWVEGDRSQRMKLDKEPWTSPRKLWRKGAKQLLWITFAGFTGLTFVAYFTPMRELVPGLINADLGGWETFWIVFYSFATYGNAGYLREQVCKYMCPYARFQSAMFDKDTLIISYDAQRGEPRSALKRGQGLARAGDCINDTLCVQVCPTGIDIRNGLQYECIACAACVDACDQVMDQIGKPRGLVRYTTQHAMDGGSTRLFRLRSVGYGIVFLALVIAFPITLALREPFSVNVIKDRNALYRLVQEDVETDHGTEVEDEIENAYVIKITNKSEQAQVFTVNVSGLHDARTTPAFPAITARAGELVVLPVEVRVPQKSAASGSTAFAFDVVGAETPNRPIKVTARFVAPKAEGHDQGHD